MKPSNSTFLILLIFVFAPTLSQAQIPIPEGKSQRVKQEIRKEVREDMREEHGEKARDQGREALKSVTYENDTRYPAPENRVQASIGITMKSFKNNGKVKDTNNMKIVFGPTGECMITNENTKNESWMLFDYEGAATYMISVKNKTAIKMPMINFQKMVQKMAERGVDVEDPSGSLEKTNEQQTINGYNSRKYVYTDEEGARTIMWFTKDISLDLSDNHLFGGQIKDFSSDDRASSKQNLNVPTGMMVRSTLYEEGKDEPSTQMDISSFEKSYDPAYFDLTGFEVTDVLGKI